MKWNDEVCDLISAYKINQTQLEKEQEYYEELQRKQKSIQNALDIAQEVAKTVQQKAHKRIAGVVTSCLKTVYGEEGYTFKIIFDKKRNRTEARLVFSRNGKEVDPLTASGGGAVDVAAFALRLSCLLLNVPPVKRCVIFDEPFRYVSEEYRDNIKQMLENLQKDLKVQFIYVTHQEALKTGNVIRIK